MRLVLSGVIVSCEWGNFVVSTGGGLGEVGSVAGGEGPEGSFVIVMMRACAVGDGLHALHWNMLSWLGC